LNLGPGFDFFSSFFEVFLMAISIKYPIFENLGKALNWLNHPLKKKRKKVFFYIIFRKNVPRKVSKNRFSEK